MGATLKPRYNREQVLFQIRKAIEEIQKTGWPENGKWRARASFIVSDKINLAAGTVESFISTLCKEEWDSLGLPPISVLDRPASARKTRQELDAAPVPASKGQPDPNVRRDDNIKAKYVAAINELPVGSRTRKHPAKKLGLQGFIVESYLRENPSIASLLVDEMLRPTA